MIVLATGNEGKVAEFREILAELGTEIVSAKEVGVTDFPEETGQSYRGKRYAIKARHVTSQTGRISPSATTPVWRLTLWTVEPGLYSARFGGDLSAEGRVDLPLGKAARCTSE